MLRVFRCRAVSFVLAGVLCASVSTTTLGLAGHADRHDAIPAVVQHDAAAHTFQGADLDPPAHPLDCLVCHWARSFRPHPDGVAYAGPADEYSLRINLDFVLFTPAALAVLPPLRSPPRA